MQMIIIDKRERYKLNERKMLFLTNRNELMIIGTESRNVLNANVSESPP